MIESEVLEVRVGDVHVTPEQVADANIGTFGPDDYVLSTGRKLEAQVVTNNSVRVFDGVMVYGGIRDVISVNKYYDIQIDNGAHGMNRNDIIVRHFAITDEVTKRGGATFQVIKGTPSEGEAADPEIAFTDLRAGALSHDMILHRVRIEGLNIVAVEPLYDILYNAAELKEEVTELNRKLKLRDYTEYQFKATDFAIPPNAGIIGSWTAPDTGYVEGFLRLSTYFSGSHDISAQLQSGNKVIQCIPTNISSASPEVSIKELSFRGYVTRGSEYAIVTNDNGGGGSGLATSRLVYRYL